MSLYYEFAVDLVSFIRFITIFGMVNEFCDGILWLGNSRVVLRRE